MASPWNDETIELLKSLWPNQSSSQIAAQMPFPCSRNMVIGKAHRLGLSIENKTAIHPLTRNTVRQSKQKANGEKNTFIRIVRKNGIGMVVADTPVRTFKPRCVEIVPLNIGLLELEPHSCRFPFGGDDGAPITFCGHTKMENSSYCVPHKDLTTAPPRPRVDRYYREVA
jgi:GcrA cell cycle regulator